MTSSFSSSHLERLWDYWVLPFNRRYTHVSTINTHHRLILPVNPYRPHLRFSRLTDKMLFAAVVLVLFLLDDALFPLLLKLWLFLLFSVSYLFLHDSNSPPQVRYYHPSRPKNRKVKQNGITSSVSTIKYSHGVALSPITNITTTSVSSSENAQHGFLSVRHCDFTIRKVKLTTDEGRWWMNGWIVNQPDMLESRTVSFQL